MSARTAYLFSKVLDISTAHITARDADELTLDSKNKTGANVIVYKYPEGYFVYAHVGDNPAEVRDFNKACRKDGYSEAFLKILAIARKNGCKYVQLDCDGLVYSQLKTFKW